MELPLENADVKHHTEMLMLEADHLLNHADNPQIAAFDAFLRSCDEVGTSFLEALDLAVTKLHTSLLVTSSIYPGPRSVQEQPVVASCWEVYVRDLNRTIYVGNAL